VTKGTDCERPVEINCLLNTIFAALGTDIKHAKSLERNLPNIGTNPGGVVPGFDDFSLIYLSRSYYLLEYVFRLLEKVAEDVFAILLALLFF
jgi:hypothetical protein